MSWASIIPQELTYQPLPLVVLTGLDIKHNAIHKEIVDAFSTRSGNKYRYKLLDGDYEYSKAKQGRPTEFNVPKGILKTNWLNKHLNLIPSLVVVFFDLDWNEPNWKEKQMECSTKVELVKQSLGERNTRIVLVLVQKNQMPVNDDNVLARERYPSLCNACSLKQGYIFLLHVEHLLGYVQKLEDDAFTEPIQSYYTLEIKAIKLKRDSLLKITHQYLFVRIDFKLAYYNEIRRDFVKAIEHYQSAYTNLLEIRISDSNLLEIKMIAGFINYKICQIHFENRRPVDAISQFRKHTDIFKSKIGISDLEFEHSAWLSKQFSLFGELFDDALRRGLLTAVQTQHPGFYYHPAAVHAQNCRNFCKNLSPTNENNSLLNDLYNLEFYGQRPWRQGYTGMEISDVAREKEAISSLQSVQIQENMTPLIIDLFKKAILFYKRYNCERMKQYLMINMAEEYLTTKDYQESLNIYVKVLNDYKNEHWWPILTSIMSNALKCALNVTDITNFCLLSIELMGQNILLSEDEKREIQINLNKVLNNQIPNEEKLDPSILARWKDVLERKEPNIGLNNSIDESLSYGDQVILAYVSGLVPFVECKVSFGSQIYNTNELVELNVYLRTNCIDPIQFSKLNIRFNNPSYNQNCIISDPNQLHFEPNKVNGYKFKFLIEKQDVGRDLEVNTICLELGDRAKRILVFYWKGDCKNALSNEPGNTHNPKRATKEDIKLWNSIKIINSTNIVMRQANIDIEFYHNSPILVNEFYSIKFKIRNKEAFPIPSLSLWIGLANNEVKSDNLAELSIGNLDNKQKAKKYENLLVDNFVEDIIYVKFNEILSQTLFVKVSYDSQIQISQERSLICTCIKEESLELKSMSPFTVDFKFLTIQMDKINSVNIGEPFILLCELKNQSSHAIKFKESSLKRVSELSFKDNLEPLSILNEEILSQNESSCECYQLVFTENTKKDSSIGDYIIEWKRADNESNQFYTQTVIKLPNLVLNNFPLYINSIVPSHASMDSNFTIKNSIKNNSNKVVKIECSLEDNEYFSICGNKSQLIVIMPLDTFDFIYSLYPLQAGYCKLPRLNIKFNQNEELINEWQNVDDIIQNMITHDLFVMPLKKDNLNNEFQSLKNIMKLL